VQLDAKSMAVAPITATARNQRRGDTMRFPATPLYPVGTSTSSHGTAG
jgi:hypothetical protein